MEQPFGSGGDSSGKKNHWRPFRKASRESPAFHLEGVPQGYSYSQLSAATGAFSEDSKLGQGGSGSVYKGVLPSGIPVAVKKINADLSLGVGMRLFNDEISIICRLSHRNLIELLGWCDDVAKNKYLLVYELMPNGSVDDALFTQAEGKAPLSWSQRSNIISGTADALSYLHEGWKKQVLHRDIKCSNIMLDEDWNAMVGDFGIARLVEHGQEADVSKIFVGTRGYIAPEVFEEGRFTDKADVYAFGVVVLEVVCGRRVLPDNSHPVGLVDWVWQNWSQGEDALLITVDKRLHDNDKEDIKRMLKIGLACCHPFPMERPSMRKVVQLLAGVVPIPAIPNSKPRHGVYFDTQFSITSLLSLKTRSYYRTRSTYISDSTQSSTINNSTTGSYMHFGFSIRRMIRGDHKRTAEKDFAKEKMEAVIEDVGTQPSLHELHDAGVDKESQKTQTTDDRTRPTNISDSTQSSSVKKPAPRSYGHSHFLVRRMRRGKHELTARKDFSREKMEVAVEKVGAQLTPHDLQGAGVGLKSQKTKQEAPNPAEVHVAEANYNADAGKKDRQCAKLHKAANPGTETKNRTKNRGAEERQHDLKMDFKTRVLENSRGGQGAEVPLPDEHPPGNRKMRQPCNVSRPDVACTSTPLSDKQSGGNEKGQRPRPVKRLPTRVVRIRGETCNAEQGPTFVTGIPVGAKKKVTRPIVPGQRTSTQESSAKDAIPRQDKHTKLIELRDRCKEMAKQTSVLAQDHAQELFRELHTLKGHVESAINSKNFDAWFKRFSGSMHS